MAQTRERAQPEAKSPPQTTRQTGQRAATPKSSTPPATSAPPASTAPWRSWLSRLRPPLTNAPTANGGTDGRPRQRTGGAIFKSFIGILIWFVASQFIMYALLMIDGALPRVIVNGKPAPMLEASHLLPPNTPLLGWITPFLLLYGGAVIGLWFLLIRLNLIPRDFFGARAQADARARRQAGGSSTAASNAATTGPRKTRAQRRYAETQAKTQATTAKGGKSNAKAPAKPTVKVTETPKANSVATGTHDQEYESVRSADRLRRRRQAKR